MKIVKKRGKKVEKKSRLLPICHLCIYGKMVTETKGLDV